MRYVILFFAGYGMMEAILDTANLIVWLTS
jgi:hypothetical protein